MKCPILIVPIAAAMLAGPLAYGADDHATHHPGSQESSVLAQAKPGKAAAGEKMRQVQDHMGMMQQKMDKYHATKDQKERAKLRGELYADMRDHMNLMRGLGGGVDRGGMTGGEAKKRQELMELRMDQTHQMMEWMFTFQSDFPVSAP